MANDFYAERFITERWPYDDQTIRYVRSATGSDNNDGLTPGTAWQTLEKGLESFAIAGVNKSWVLDLAGTFTGANTLNLGGTQLAGIDADLDVAATGPDNFIAYSSCQLRASLDEVVPAINITGTALQPTTGFYILTVSNALVAGAHEGQILAGTGLLEWARIIRNTVNTITVAVSLSNPSTWTAPAIYQEGATISYGDAGNFFEQATYLITLCDWSFSGIAFTSNGAAKDSAINVISNATTFFQGCSFRGLYLQGGSGLVTFDTCDVYDKLYGHDGSSVLWRNSTFRDLGYRCHGANTNGNNSWIDCAFTGGLDPFGEGNVESTFYFNLTRCWFDDSADDAIHVLFGNTRLVDVRIENTAGDCIEVANPSVRLTCTDVDGTTGNLGVGIRALRGAYVTVDGATSVTGALGDLSIGDVGIVTYAALPIVDLGQLVRVSL